MRPDSPKTTSAFRERLRSREEAHGLTDEQVAHLEKGEIFRRLESAIGNTPVKVIALPNENVLLQKDETANPGESHYDRCYLALLQALENEGTIQPGNTLLETSSGSAGISFAWIAKKLGYKSVVFMPDYVAEPRITEARNLADEVHLSSDRNRYMTACAEMMVAYLRARKRAVLEAGGKIWMPNHSQNPVTPRAFARIADEMRADKTRPIDFFIGGAGNGSTLLGIGKRLKELCPSAKVIGFEPVTGCPYYQKERRRWGQLAPRFAEDKEIPDHFIPHALTGTGGSGDMAFPFMDEAIGQGIIDDICVFPERDVLAVRHYNNGELPENQFGNTTLVARYIAETMAQKVHGKVFFSLAYDKADRY